MSDPAQYLLWFSRLCLRIPRGDLEKAEAEIRLAQGGTSSGLGVGKDWGAPGARGARWDYGVSMGSGWAE